MTVEATDMTHRRSITVEEFDALPVDTSHRYEIENGFLLVNARPAPPHSRAVTRLIGQLNNQLPAGLEAFAELEAELVGRSPRQVPDVVVAPVEVDEQPRVRSEQIVLAIEIASSGESAVRDYAIKAGEYAANKIANYWVIDILDTESVGLTIYTLDTTGEYHITPRATGTVTVESPFPLTIDLDALTGRRTLEN
ncbi:Uma2 family endonuclease [Nocardia sp. CDC159]|uniref:Uma2 family endonuclease n=1 Tax=Nocardia pulmonis TaxID=2951408 RepID=A0A9X2IZB5_9NOCA|nr:MULTISPECIES: Uma2 family endonuclease [Nocardia]MCM6775840.1 Uma2 family endonuclease [Nocardia pulmonis]MCM6788184.1 Uma2 family endonuclease [Nocardia sp. CDC159]